jgi:hypothetical protein
MLQSNKIESTMECRDICCKAIKLNPLWNVEKVTPGNKEFYDDGR